jgi:hemerythrin-like metal-binding protein
VQPNDPSRRGSRLALALLCSEAMGPKGWTEALATRNEALDAQHLELFGLHAKVCAASRAGEAGSVPEMLQKLRELTRRHFAFEEQHMAALPDATQQAHSSAHVAFMRDLDSLVAEAGRNACSQLVQLWLESRYASWWSLHVRSHDAGLAVHLAAAAAVAGAAAVDVTVAEAAPKPSEARKA